MPQSPDFSLLASVRQKEVFPGDDGVFDIEEFPALRPFFEKWEQTPAVIDSAFRDQVITSFRQFHNLENSGPESSGARQAHNALTNYLVSDNILPSLAALHEYAITTNDSEALTDASTVFFILNEALQVLETYADRPRFGFESIFRNKDGSLNLPAAFSHLMGSAIDGHPMFATFTELMKLVRYTARQSLWKNREKPVDEYVSPIMGATFKERSTVAILEFKEAKNGVSFNGLITERLLDPDTQAFVLSLDYNSTFNLSESFVTPQLIEKATEQLNTLIKLIQNNFPSIQLYVVLNTGRPGMYAWGVLQALKPVTSVIALAESGGVVVNKNDGKGEVAVENSHEWQKQLGLLRNAIQGDIQTIVHVEDKQSMLSMEIAPQNSTGNDWLHTTRTENPVSQEWVTEKVKHYLDETHEALVDEYRQLLSDAVQLPGLQHMADTLFQAMGQADPDGRLGTQDDLTAEKREQLSGFFREHENEKLLQASQVETALKTIENMQKYLVVDFNSTAGFVDIHHKLLNKYSTLRRELVQNGVDPKKAIMIHVGDSRTDTMPDETDEEGQTIPTNADANSVILVGVGNSSNQLKSAILQRGDNGILAVRPAVIGLIDVIERLTWETSAAIQLKKELINEEQSRSILNQAVV